MIPRVKICGITRVEDGLAAVAAGADAVGFVFWPGSPRAVDPVLAGRIARTLPPFVARVGVFVNAPLHRILSVVEVARLTAVQLHGDETPVLAERLPVPVIRTFRGAPHPDELSAWRCATLLLDAPEAGAVPRYGGSGRPADADAATRLAGNPRFMLAGGLTPDTVGIAVARYRPAAVDVSSGVEIAPGIKDPTAMRAFVEAARYGAAAPRSVSRSRRLASRRPLPTGTTPAAR